MATGALESAKKHNHKTKLDEAIFKATQSKPDPPKEKHDRTILMEARNARTASHIFSALFQRSVSGKEVVLFKTLLLVHKILREGPDNCLEDCYQRKDFLDSLKAQYDNSGTAMGSVDHAYVLFLLAKLKFHHTHTDVSGDVSLPKWKEKNKKFRLKDMIGLVDDLLELQKSLLLVQQRILQSQGLNECRIAGLIPIILESHAIYTMSEAFIKKLVDIEADSNAVEQFLTQYPVIQKFYFNCATIPYLTGRVNVPTLPAEPPTFKPSGKAKKKDDKSRKGDKDTDLIDTSVFISTSGLPTTFDPFAANFAPSQPAPSTNVFMGASSNPFGGFLLGQPQPQPVAQPPPQPVFQPAPTFSSQPTDPFASLAALSMSLTQPTPANSGLFGGSSGSTNPFAPTPTSSSPFDSFSQFGSTASPFAPSPQPTESREALERRIRELESLIRETELKVEDVSGKNNEIRRLLQDKTSALAEVEKQMRQRIQHQQDLFQQANKELQARLTRMVSKYEQDKLLLLNEQVDFAKNSVEQQLAKFNDPSWAGNRGATAENIQQTLKALAQNYESLIKSLENSTDSVSVCRALADATTQLLDDAKGALSRVSNPASKQQIGTGATQATGDVIRMFTHTKAIGQQGSKPDKGQIEFLRGEYNRVVQNLTLVNSAVVVSSSELSATTSGVDLETAAERELQKTSQAIQYATQKLASHQEQQKIRALQGGKGKGELDVEGTMLGGLLAITHATKSLVDAATQTQQERVKKATTGVGYHRDPAWTEGLINAANNVIKATEQLVQVGEGIAQGRMDDQALIGASRALSAATTQLITACRAKSDASSHASRLLDDAAAAVTRATRALVEAARSLKSPEQMAILQNSELFAQQVIGEIEQQTKIIRLENELALAQKVQSNMKRAKANQAEQPQPTAFFPPSEQNFALPVLSVTTPSGTPSTTVNPFMS